MSYGKPLPPQNVYTTNNTLSPQANPAADMERYINGKTETTKHDAGKAQYSLLPWNSLAIVADVMTYGAAKYGRDNWRIGTRHSRYIDACMRHLAAYMDGEVFDPESKLLHLAHAVCNLLFLLEYTQEGIGEDDIRGDK